MSLDFSTIQTALATLVEPRIANAINRAVVLGQVLDVVPGDSKNVTWDVKFGTATPTTAVITDGTDVSVYNNDTEVPATLNYGIYHDAFSITGLALAAARATGNPAQLANLFVEKMNDSVTRLARAIGSHIYTGTGSSGQINGLYDPTVPAIGDTGSYAGVDPGTYPQWKGSVVDASGGALSFALIRDLRRTIYVACGEKPDLFVTDPVQHEKLGLLYQTQRRYLDEVRRADGTVVKLDGGYQVLEFDGIAVIEDAQHPAQKFGALNTQHVRMRQLPDAPDVANRAMGTVQVAGTPEEQLGAGKMKLTARIQPLAITGDAYKFALYVYPALQVRRRNACGYITGLQA